MASKDFTKSPYITKDGYQALHSEVKALWEKRRKVVRHLADAAAEGDRSENAEYIYRKKQLREIDRRIYFIQKRLPILKIIDEKPKSRSQIYFGAWVTLFSKDKGTNIYRIVGADEFNAKKKWISIESPLAKALLQRKIGEKIKIKLPDGSISYEIKEIKY